MPASTTALAEAPETMQGLLIWGAEKWSDRPFIHFEDGTVWTREQCLAEAQTAAKALARAGVQCGDRVAVVLPNGPDWLRAWWGISLLGAVAVPLNPDYRGQIFVDLLALSDPAFIISEGPVAEAPPSAKPIASAGLSTAEGEMPALPQVSPDDPHIIIFTSGTTGNSKGSLTSNLHVCAQSAWLAESGTLTERDRFLGNLPLFHMAALGNLIGMMRVGGSVAVRTRPTFSNYWQVARETGATYAVLVSSMAGKLMNDPVSPDERNHSMRFFLASPLPAAADAFIERFGLEGLVSGFGSTESSTAICKPIDVENRRGTCGKARKGWEVRIVDENGNDVPDGVRGELIIRPVRRGFMSLGYFNNEAATEEAWRGGWYHTGDVLERDSDGFYFWRDRLKESMRRRGENVSSYEVERELNTFPGVVESACVSVTGAFEGDEEIKAFIVAHSPVDFAELVRHVSDKLPHFMVPRFYQLIDELPKTPTMRIQKMKLKALGRSADDWDREAAGVEVKRAERKAVS